MSDVVDIANQLNDEAVERAIANRVQSPTGVSPLDCIECDEPIEQKRREVIPGTKHCSKCAKYFAELNRFNNGGRS